MELSTRPAAEFSIAELTGLFNRSFEGYFVTIQLNEASTMALFSRDNVDLESSHVLLANGEPAGVALIARRAAESRLAGMGMVTSIRGQGAGSWLVPRLLDEARQRGESRMHLEVITQNAPAIHLYEKYGFHKVRQLLGYQIEKPQASSADVPTACGPALISELIAAGGFPNLPWQVDGDTLKRVSAFGFQLGEAYVALTNPEAEHVAIRALIVAPDARRKGQASALLRALFAAFPGKTWHISAVFPEEMGGTFEKVGFVKEKFSQWQMVCDL